MQVSRNAQSNEKDGMHMSANESKQKATPEFVASRSHTAIVLLVLGVLAAGGFYARCVARTI
jgi:hypothetical protein